MRRAGFLRQREISRTQNPPDLPRSTFTRLTQSSPAAPASPQLPLDGLAEEDVIFVVYPFILDIAEEFIPVLVNTINVLPGIADVKTGTSARAFTFCVF